MWLLSFHCSFIKSLAKRDFNFWMVARDLDRILIVELKRELFFMILFPRILLLEIEVFFIFVCNENLLFFDYMSLSLDSDILPPFLLEIFLPFFWDGSFVDREISSFVMISGVSPLPGKCSVNFLFIWFLIKRVLNFWFRGAHMLFLVLPLSLFDLILIF